jgi:hypothetical protein
MEASGYGHWFERLLGELQFQLWAGDAAAIKTKRVRTLRGGVYDPLVGCFTTLKDNPETEQAWVELLKTRVSRMTDMFQKCCRVSAQALETIRPI